MDFQTLKTRLIREIETMQDQQLIEDLLIQIKLVDKKEKAQMQNRNFSFEFH